MLLNKRVPLTYIINKVKVELIYVLLIGLAIYSITNEFSYIIPDVPYAIPTFLGTAISVILSFKLSQSYDRWWEARKIWGSIVNDSRNLVEQLKCFVKPGNEQAIKTIALRQIAWCYSLGNSLRQHDALKGLEKYLPAEELSTLRRHNNAPLAILDMNNADITKMRLEQQLDIFSHIQLNNTLVNLCNWMGMAERIKSTVFPVTYRFFLHSAIYLFIVTLSISLRGLQSYFEVPLLMIIAALFFLLERTATHLQDPFSDKPTDTAMTAIATTIEINLKQLLGINDVPEPAKTDGYYLK